MKYLENKKQSLQELNPLRSFMAQTLTRAFVYCLMSDQIKRQSDYLTCKSTQNKVETTSARAAQGRSKAG